MARGYDIPYPPGWQAAPAADGALELRPLDWPDNPVVVRARPAPSPLSNQLPAGANGSSVFERGWSFGASTPGSQRLIGRGIIWSEPPGHMRISVLFSGEDRVYELALRFPTGFANPQPLLTDFTAIVEGFRIDHPALAATLGPEPTAAPAPTEAPTETRATTSAFR